MAQLFVFAQPLAFPASPPPADDAGAPGQGDAGAPAADSGRDGCAADAGDEAIVGPWRTTSCTTIDFSGNTYQDESGCTHPSFVRDPGPALTFAQWQADGLDTAGACQ